MSVTRLRCKGFSIPLKFAVQVSACDWLSIRSSRYRALLLPARPPFRGGDSPRLVMSLARRPGPVHARTLAHSYMYPPLPALPDVHGRSWDGDFGGVFYYSDLALAPPLLRSAVFRLQAGARDELK